MLLAASVCLLLAPSAAMSLVSHEAWMTRALRLGERGRYSTAPNPW